MRRALLWTAPDQQHREALAKLPVWGALVPEGFFYGFPLGDEGVDGLKIAVHRSEFIADLDAHVDPETVDRSLRDEDRGPIEDFMHLYFPAAQGEIATHSVCMYCTTPSWDFLVDRHPACESVVVAGGFSGHGFKFAHFSFAHHKS
jgi:glycine/D-amino acid oxidase-like deaminating enzyme